MKASRDIDFVLFGATGDLALKKIFPALETLYAEGALGESPRVVAVGRREWNDAEFVEFLRASSGVSSKKFLAAISYSVVDIEAGTGYEALAERMALGSSPKRQAVYYTALAPALHGEAAKGLKRAGLLYRAIASRAGKPGPKLLIEKPFGTDQKSARVLDKLLASILDESQIFRIDHYLGKETVRAMMDLHESAPGLARMLTTENVSRIRVRQFEEQGIHGRGASYDRVGAFRDIGQNHMLEMLAVIAAEPSKDWQAARTEALERLSPPVKTCALSRRAQYEGYLQEKGVAAGSQTETAFEVIANFSKGKLKAVPILLEGAKKADVSEAFVEISFRDVSDLPQRMIFRLQPEPDIVIEYRDDSAESFEIPPSRGAYGNIILDALLGNMRSFVGRDEIEALWGYADHVVACWGKVPLEKYGGSSGKGTPFLIQ